MNQYHDYLKNEADYQDLKITDDPRRGIGKVYCDASSRHRFHARDVALGELHQKKILDLGCGNGVAAMKSLRAGAYVTAIDISQKSIDFLIANAQKEQLDDHLTALVMDAHHLTFEDETFDIVYGDGILHHLPMLEAAIKEIHRVLKPSGYAVFLEPLGTNPFLNVFRKFTPRMRTVDEQPFRIKELNIIKDIFPCAQFVFYDCATLIAKIPLLFGCQKLSNLMQKKLISLDDVLIRSNKRAKISFLQKMSWMVLIKMSKN